jgi:dTDP-4-dehydrorhamnose 3,5-epimerase-like enzyme
LTSHAVLLEKDKYDLLLGDFMTLKYDRLRVVTDSRGVVFEPIESDAIGKHKNAHIVISGPGVTRGNHYHEKGEETMAVMGHALVRTRDDSGINDMEVPAGEVYKFIFPSGVSHAIRNLSDQPNILAAFNTTEHDPQNPDTVRDIIL